MRKRFLSVMIPLMLLHCILGCAGFFKGYGAISPDQNVTKSFEAFQVNPKFDYYYSGSDMYPNALIGLDKRYKLEPDLWKKMETMPEDFKAMIGQMQTRALMLGQSQHGFTILDDRDRQIGVWYSILSATTAVKIKDDETVLIYAPPLNTYLKYEEEKGHSR